MMIKIMCQRRTVSADDARLHACLRIYYDDYELFSSKWMREEMLR
jgi:hypothetical protein